jgi:hypothetical protein
MSRAKKAYRDAGAQQALALGVIGQTGRRIIATVILHSLELWRGSTKTHVLEKRKLGRCREAIVMCSRDDLPRSPGTYGTFRYSLRPGLAFN